MSNSEQVERDVPAPNVWGARTEGWDFSLSTLVVWRGWSRMWAHGIIGINGMPCNKGRGVEGSQAFFSSRKRALLAMRQAAVAAGKSVDVFAKIDLLLAAEDV